MLKTDGFHSKKFKEFWKDRIKEVGEVPLIISGIGFDPRSLQAGKILLEENIVPKFIPIDFAVESSGESDKIITKARERNRNFLSKFNVLHDPIKIDMFDEFNHSVGGREIVNKIYEIKDHFSNIRDVIIDIGGLPRTLFSPMLSYLINAKTKTDFGFKNLHVASLPEEYLDRGIISEENLDPSFMFGFDQPPEGVKFVWIPIIGKNDPERLRKIYSKIEVDCIEICPILPFRPNYPKQVESLLMNLRDVLFNEIHTFDNNIIYIDHRTPFFVFREIIELSKYYNKLLQDLSRDVKVLITPLDDKTSCVGAILAAVTENLPIMYADTIRYKIPDPGLLIKEIKTEPIEIWISGEAYEN